MDYTTPADVLAWLNQTGAPAGDRYAVIVPKAIAAATEWIDGYCGRSFNKVAATGEGAGREFRGDGTRSLFMDDTVVVKSVEVRDTIGADWEPLAKADWALGPAKGTWPANTLWRAPGGLWPCLDYPFTSVRVEGTFGWPAVPAKVKQAAVFLACHYMVLFSSPFLSAGEVEDPVIGQGTTSDVTRILRSYRRLAVA